MECILAIGDVISDLDDISSGFIDFQPAAGVEVLITSFSVEAFSNAETLRFTDGVLTDSVFAQGILLDGDLGNYNIFKTFITNTVYLRRSMTSPGPSNLGYSGIQTQ